MISGQILALLIPYVTPLILCLFCQVGFNYIDWRSHAGQYGMSDLHACDYVMSLFVLAHVRHGCAIVQIGCCLGSVQLVKGGMFWVI